jgi:hypothetical protein
MTKLLFSLLCALCLCTPFFAQEEILTEEAQIALLIDATKISLERLQELQNHLFAFRKQEAYCIDSSDDIEGLYQLSHCALNLLQAIQKANVEPYFRVSFLEELETISKTAKHNALPSLSS